MDLDELNRHIHNLSQMISNTEITALSKMPAKGATLSGTDPKEQEENLATAKKRLGELRDQWIVKRQKNATQKRKIEQMEGEIAAISAAGPETKARSGKPDTIQPGDILVVEVLEALPGRPITGERVVRPDGTISLGFYGDLEVAGLTRRECKIKVVEYLRKFLSDESLGLKDVDDEGKTTKKVEPADSDHVYVDDSNKFIPDRRSSESLEKKLDRILSEMGSRKRVQPLEPKD